MKLEGEYAIDKGEWAHRIASSVIYAVWIYLSFEMSGHGRAIRAAVHYFLPIACIWFPGALATCAGILWGMGRSSEPWHPLIVRWGAWLLLVFVALLVTILTEF